MRWLGIVSSGRLVVAAVCCWVSGGTSTDSLPMCRAGIFCAQHQRLDGLAVGRLKQPRELTLMSEDNSNGYVLLDSCVYCADLHGTGTKTAVLVEGVERLNYTLLLPEVVRDEVLGKYRNHLAEVSAGYDKSVRDVQRLLGNWPKVEFPKMDAEKLAGDYAKRFPYGISASRVVSLPYPPTAHREIALRAIERRKPFKEGGSGYRDCLIFETLKHYLSQNPGRAVLFVSLNHRDFFVESQLHPHLLADLQSSQVDPSCVKPFMDLGSFVETHFFPHLQSLDRLCDALQSGQHGKFNVLDWVKTDLPELLREGEWASAIVGVDAVHSYVSKCHKPDKLVVDDVKLLPSGDLLVSLSTHLNIEMSVSFDGHSYDRDYAGVCELVGKPDGPVDDATAWIPVPTYLRVSLVLDKDCSQVKSSQVDSLEGRGGYWTTSG